MSSASFTADTRDLKKLAHRLNDKAFDASDRRRLMKAFGAELEDQTKERFKTKESPEGETWKELSNAYAEYLAVRFPGAEPPLVIEGGLRDSIESQTSEWSVLTGATKVYAAVHQFGWDEKNILPRPYLGIGSDDEKKLVGILDDFLEAKLRRTA